MYTLTKTCEKCRKTYLDKYKSFYFFFCFVLSLPLKRCIPLRNKNLSHLVTIVFFFSFLNFKKDFLEALFLVILIVMGKKSKCIEIVIYYQKNKKYIKNSSFLQFRKACHNDFQLYTGLFSLVR